MNAIHILRRPEGGLFKVQRQMEKKKNGICGFVNK